jgi:3-deoxy-manno-octulosonate cytidylyltransferase (CMP-KDO synthetase)
MSTLKCSIKSPEEFFDPNVVKVVTDQFGFVVYFSRWPIPFHRDDWSKGVTIPAGRFSGHSFKSGYRHVGLYVYKKDFLLLFARLPETPLEKLEKLEQLRALENGHKIKVIETDYQAVGVDVPEDLERVLKML